MERSQTVREVIYECTLYPYSNEYYDLLKEAMELDLAQYAVEAGLASTVYEEEAQYLPSEYLFEANEEFVESVMYEEGTILAQEESFLSKIWNTIKKTFNKFINFWKRLFLGARRKIQGDDVYRDAIKNHAWGQDECRKFIEMMGGNTNDLEDCLNFFKARFIKDSDITGMRFEDNVSKRDRDLVKLLLNEQLNPEQGTFCIPFFQKSGDDDSGSPCDPEELFNVAKEIVAAKSKAAGQAAEKHLKAIMKEAKEKGIELRKDHENLDKVMKKLEAARDDMEKYIDAAKKVARERAEDARELYQKGKEKAQPYVDKAKSAAKEFGDEVKKNVEEGREEFKPGKFSDRVHYKAMKTGMKHMGGYWRSRLTELMGIVVKCIGKTMNSLSWYRKLSDRAVNAYEKCKDFVTDKMQKLVDAKRKYYG